MPIYEYQCDSCGHRLERIQKFSDPPVAACPLCGAAVRKLMSSPAIQFKGSGFYITDYAKAGQPGKDKEGTGDSGKARDSSSSDKGAADKPAEKSTPAAEKSSSSDTSGKTESVPKAPVTTSK